jgi:hypothetical protein
MENGYESDAHAEAFGISGDLAQRLGDGAEQDAVDYRRVLQGQRRGLVRQGKDNVGVRDGQNFACPTS